MLGFVLLMAIVLTIWLPFGYYFYDAIKLQVLGRILDMGIIVILNVLLGLYCWLVGRR